MDLTSRSPQSPVSVYHNNSQHHLHLEANHVRSAAPPGRCQSPTASGILTVPPPPERTALPKVGQTRCYWALLTTSLQFLVLDPVLRHHLQDQAPRILDCALLDFVHPDEKESAQRDLGNVLEERTLHGSVTRVRYYRLSRVRRLLGWSDSSLPYPPTFPAERIAIDTDYMAVYLVVNCVANGLVLCFIHAAVDIAPRADNDEFHKTGWSNWCSTYGFEEEQACALYQRLCETTMPVPKSFEISCDPSLRVLQIFRNQPDRPLVLSWPPDSALFQTGYILPTADDLAQLAQDVQIGYSMGNGGGDDARTSCTRRYKSIQTVRLQTTEGSKAVQVESIFIPHGTIIFACHKVNGAYLDTIHAYSSLQNQRNQQLSQVSGTELGEMGDAGNQVYDGSMMAESQQDLVSQTYVQQWVDGQSQSQQQQDHYTWSDHRGNALLQGQWHSELQFVEKSLPITARTSDMRDQTSHAAGTNPISDGAGPMALSATPSTSHAARISDEGSRSSSHDAEKLASVGKDRPTKERYNGFARGQGSPPAGVAQCAHCQTTHSPEWRKGPSGKKDLCNACGLRFSRSRAKKDGIVSRKRRDKEKEASSNKHSRMQPDFAVAKAVSEAHKPADHGESTQPWPAQTPVINSGEEHSRSNGFSSTRALGHPGANLSAGPVSSTFGFVETTPGIQMPYFS